NRELIMSRLEEAKAAGADLVLFPELAITGYPPEDLLLRPSFIRAAKESLAQVARTARGIVALVGTPHFDRDLYNACAVCAGGEVLARAPGFEEALLVVEVEPEEAVGRRLRDVRRRALETEREEAPDVPVVHVGSPRTASNGDPVAAEAAPLLDDLEQMRR